MEREVILKPVRFGDGDTCGPAPGVCTADVCRLKAHRKTEVFKRKKNRNEK